MEWGRSLLLTPFPKLPFPRSLTNGKDRSIYTGKSQQSPPILPWATAYTQPLSLCVSLSPHAYSHANKKNHKDPHCPWPSGIIQHPRIRLFHLLADFPNSFTADTLIQNPSTFYQPSYFPESQTTFPEPKRVSRKLCEQENNKAICSACRSASKTSRLSPSSTAFPSTVG